MKQIEKGFTKRKLVDVEMAYAVQRVSIDEQDHVIASPEGYGAIYLMRAPDWNVSVLTDGPGGTMSIVGVDSQRVLAIMGCFPGYNFHDAGIYLMERKGKPLGEPWDRTKVLDLPFAHRIEQIRHRDKQWLVAASLAESKDNPDDWSRPGTVYAGEIPAPGADGWQLEPVLEKLHKNHGMFKGQLDGNEIFIITGTEAAYLYDLREENSDLWAPRTLFDYEISEICTVDLDGDGRDELVTIEPFHGNLLRVYKRGGKSGAGEGFEVIAEEALAFGHGLWCGAFNGAPSILVGNRRGDYTLKLFRATDGDASRLAETVIDRDSGPANIAVVPRPGGDIVFTTNQNSKEIALYESSLA